MKPLLNLCRMLVQRYSDYVVNLLTNVGGILHPNAVVLYTQTLRNITEKEVLGIFKCVAMEKFLTSSVSSFLNIKVIIARRKDCGSFPAAKQQFDISTKSGPTISQ